MAAKFLPGSQGKELIEETQRKGVFAFTINNLRAKKGMPLLRIQKGNGNSAGLLLRDF